MLPRVAGRESEVESPVVGTGGAWGKRVTMKVYIQEAERTKAYKKTDLSLVDLLCEPAQKILSKVDPSRIEGVFVSVQNISSFTGEGDIATKVADRLGLRGAEAERIETASNGQTALLRAYDAVASGRCRRVIAIGGEKMSAVEREARSRIISEVIDPIDRACGLTMPSAIALISLEYARVNGVAFEDFKALLEKIAIRSYRYAAANPDAQFSGKAITAEEYRDALRNPPVATPLHVFDSCPTSDASGAILVTNKETDIEISGVGHAVDGSRIAASCNGEARERRRARGSRWRSPARHSAPPPTARDQPPGHRPRWSRRRRQRQSRIRRRRLE